MRQLTIILAAIYACSLAALAATGIFPTPPWFFLIGLFLFILPVAYLSTQGGFLLSRVVGPESTWLPFVALVAGLAITGTYHFVFDIILALLLAFAATLAFATYRGMYNFTWPFFRCLPALFFGFASVWSLNYLFASLTFDSVNDSALWSMDLAIYQWLLNTPADGIGIFPIVRHPVAFAYLQNAYHLAFAGILLAVFVSYKEGQDARSFLLSLFACYFLALVVFLLYPAIGPSLSYPEIFSPAFEHTQTYDIMKRTYMEYQALKTGTTETGFAYFVAVPSLHVAIAVIVQAYLRRSRAHFWLFLPVNALVLPATVLLGYHYLIDVPAGVLLAATVLAAPGAYRAASAAITRNYSTLHHLRPWLRRQRHIREGI